MFKKIAISIRNNTLFGLVLVVPIAVSVIIINWTFKLVTNSFVNILPEDTLTPAKLFAFRAGVLLALLVALFLIGLLARNFIGRRLYQAGDRVLTRIPVFSKIYTWVRSISESFLDQGQSMFQEVVMVEYPRKGVYSVGFLTSHVPKRYTNLLPAPDNTRDYVCVFIPTTPNPTSGWFAIVPREEAIKLTVSVAEAMKLIISGGAVMPGDDLVDARPTFFDKLENWLAKKK